MVNLARPLASVFTAFVGVTLVAQAAGPVQAGRVFFPPLAAGTEAGWKQYVSATEQRIGSELKDPKRFLVLAFGATAASDRQAVLAGGLSVSKMDTRSSGGAEIDVPDGWAHHWRGTVLIRGARLDQVLKRLQEQVPGTGKGDVIASRVVSDGTHLRTFIKIRRAGRLIMAYDFVYNTEHEVTFTRRTATTGVSTSVATKIAEMYHPGTAGECEFGPGEDSRLLQRWNSYWRYEEVPEGVIAECESITLSRRGPFGFGRSFADGTAQESMEKALTNLRDFFATPTRTPPASWPARSPGN